MQCSPYALIRAEVLDQLRQQAGQALQTWCDGWGVARADVELECLRAWEGAAQLPAAPVWRQCWRAGARSVALCWAGEMPAQVQRLLYAPDRQYGPAGAAVTAAAAGEAAWQDLLQALGAALSGGAPAADAQAPSPADWRHASGAVLLVLRIGRHTCCALLNHETVLALAGGAPPAPLPALDYPGLLAALPVRLPVALGAAEVDLGSLTRLQVGDVIRLDTAADRALRVAGPSGAPLFDGYLGRAGEQLALELAPHDTTFGVNYES